MCCINKGNAQKIFQNSSTRGFERWKSFVYRSRRDRVEVTELGQSKHTHYKWLSSDRVISFPHKVVTLKIDVLFLYLHSAISLSKEFNVSRDELSNGWKISNWSDSNSNVFHPRFQSFFVQLILKNGGNTCKTSSTSGKMKEPIPIPLLAIPIASGRFFLKYSLITMIAGT